MNRLAMAMTVVAAMALLACASAQAATVIDSDTFSTAGDGPGGWTVPASNGTAWASDGSVLSAGTKTYSTSQVYRGTFTYDSSQLLTVSVDMKPTPAGDSNAQCGFGFLVPSVAGKPLYGANGGVGYYLMHYSSGSLKLMRDHKQWDGVPVAAGTYDNSANTGSMHNYKVTIDHQGGNTAEFNVYIDNSPTAVISYTDTAFLPTAGFTTGSPYTSYYAGLENTDWATHSTQFDNWQITEGVVAVPEPATMALLGLGGLALAGARRRRAA